VIETRRLCIRSFHEEDWQAVHAYSTDPEVVQYVPGKLPSIEETREVIRSWINGQSDDPPHYDFAVTVRPNDFVIGWCCIQISSSNSLLGELMYVLNRQFWKKGYAFEAAEATVEYGFSELKLHRIFATCRPENIASWHILEKLGMQREGLLRENTWIRGRWHNSYLYAIIDHEWKARENGFS
jgi:RimJ/RimL family protein N-acetyltransferase